MQQMSLNASSSPTCLPPQGKDDFERQQKELLDKENIIKQSQVQLGQEQVRREADDMCGVVSYLHFLTAVSQIHSVLMRHFSFLLEVENN